MAGGRNIGPKLNWTGRDRSGQAPCCRRASKLLVRINLNLSTLRGRTLDLIPRELSYSTAGRT